MQLESMEVPEMRRLGVMMGSNKISNIPTSGVDYLTGCIYFVPFIADDSVRWVKKCFTISKGLVSGESIKTVPAQ